MGCSHSLPVPSNEDLLAAGGHGTSTAKLVDDGDTSSSLPPRLLDLRYGNSGEPSLQKPSIVQFELPRKISWNTDKVKSPDSITLTQVREGLPTGHSEVALLELTAATSSPDDDNNNNPAKTVASLTAAEDANKSHQEEHLAVSLVNDNKSRKQLAVLRVASPTAEQVSICTFTPPPSSAKSCKDSASRHYYEGRRLYEWAVVSQQPERYQQYQLLSTTTTPTPSKGVGGGKDLNKKSKLVVQYATEPAAGPKFGGGGGGYVVQRRADGLATSSNQHDDNKSSVAHFYHNKTTKTFQCRVGTAGMDPVLALCFVAAMDKLQQTELQRLRASSGVGSYKPSSVLYYQ